MKFTAIAVRISGMFARRVTPSEMAPADAVSVAAAGSALSGAMANTSATTHPASPRARIRNPSTATRCRFVRRTGPVLLRARASGGGDLGAGRAAGEMIVDQAHGLHEGIGSRGTDEAKSPAAQVFGQRQGFGRLGRHVGRDPRRRSWLGRVRPHNGCE